MLLEAVLALAQDFAKPQSAAMCHDQEAVSGMVQVRIGVERFSSGLDGFHLASGVLLRQAQEFDPEIISRKGGLVLGLGNGLHQLGQVAARGQQA